MKTLGHHPDDDGSVRSCSRHVFAATSGSFWGNASKGLLKSSRAAKLRFLCTSMCTIARFRCSRWPYTRSLAKRLDAEQRRYLYRLFPVKPHPGETIDNFYHRRHLTTCRLAQRVGKWSEMWASDVVKWRDHVRRGHDIHAWSPKLLLWSGQGWPGLQRLWHSAFGESRTKTRALRGCVHRRWEEGVHTAIAVVSI